jgi:hypothetical protein
VRVVGIVDHDVTGSMHVDLSPFDAMEVTLGWSEATISVAGVTPRGESFKGSLYPIARPLLQGSKAGLLTRFWSIEETASGR